MLAYMLAGDAIGAGNPDRAKGRALQLEARRHHDTYDRLPSLTMPVYICGGRYDGIAPPANLEALHAQIPGSQLEFFEGGHAVHAAGSRGVPAHGGVLRGWRVLPHPRSLDERVAVPHIPFS